MRPSIKKYNFVIQNTSTVNALFNATCGVTRMFVNSFVERKLQRSDNQNSILEYFFVADIGVMTPTTDRAISRGVLASIRSLNILEMVDAIVIADRRESNGQR